MDACRLAELTAGKFGKAGGLEPLPGGIVEAADKYVPPASAVLKSPYAKYVLPHWACGMFLVYRADNQAIDQATSFEQFKHAIDPEHGKPMLTDLYGTTGLGEIYAHAVVDNMGPAKAAQHLKDLCAANGKDPQGSQRLVETTMDPASLQAVLDIKPLLPSKVRDYLKYYHQSPLAEVYPDLFAEAPEGSLFGYSERLYFAERAQRLSHPGAALPVFASKDLRVKRLPFGAKSLGTPTWVDTFVIPKGKLSPKRRAIETFLRFVNTAPAYACFVHLDDSLPSTYLLPATRAEYQSKEVQQGEPILVQYKNLLDDSFPVLEPEIWQGMKAAGPVIKSKLGHEN